MVAGRVPAPTVALPLALLHQAACSRWGQEGAGCETGQAAGRAPSTWLRCPHSPSSIPALAAKLGFLWFALPVPGGFPGQGIRIFKIFLLCISFSPPIPAR